jgi:hypothetical protein
MMAQVLVVLNGDVPAAGKPRPDIALYGAVQNQ